MNLKGTIYKSMVFHARYYKLVCVATLITVAVVTGSLVVGDSVRTTLVKRVAERLGDTQTIIFSRHSFLSEALADAPLFGGEARGILLTNGFVAHRGKLIPVFVWGVDDLSIAKGSARVNPALLGELGGNDREAVVLRLPAAGLVPSGSLFVTENYTTSMRLTLEGVLGAEDGGNISMKNEQVLPLNIFVGREELSEVMQTEGKINLILAAGEVSEGELQEVWEYSSSGLSVTRREGFTEITSDRVFLQSEVVETIGRDNRNANRMFSYLANSIRGNAEAAIPYSFVTAADNYRGRTLSKDEIILSDYSAERLQVKSGDRVGVVYFTSHDLKTLQTDSLSLRVKEVVPLTELLADSTLSADFPGLSDVERCTDWDSDLPIDMDRITDEDEKYWELYRDAPKAIIAYDAVAADWGNAYGNATAIRIPDVAPNLSGLNAGMFGIQVIHPREQGLYAAINGVDFSGLFLALGFFIVVSAILLMLVPVSEMLYRRRFEIDLLKALGYTRRRIARIFLMESAPVVLLSSIAGVVAGLLYTGLVVWLLGNVWRGATQTEGFSVYPSVGTVIMGFCVGVVLLPGLLYGMIIRSLKDKKRQAGKKVHSLKWKKRCVIFSTLLAVATMAINFIFFHAVALFVVAGIIVTGTAALWGEYLICRNGADATADASAGFDADRLVWSTLFAQKKQALLSFFALATGVFIVFSVGLNRKGFADSSQLRTGTGGFSLWCESSVPVYHNMSTTEGKAKLSLADLPADTEILQCFRYGADDASCLNLNKVGTPTVLGLDMNALAVGDFQLEQNIYAKGREETFRQMQKPLKPGEAYPALVDATVLTWGLMKNLGDTLWYANDRGEPVAIRLAGTLSNSIFQGNLLIDRRFFAEIWPETTGSEVFLLKTQEADREEAGTLLAQALSEYGISVSTTNDRLKQFNTVTDTYLTIFLTLGGLGLLLGIVSFIIVIRKNLSARRHEIDLYRTLGFPDIVIEQTLYRENLLVPLYAIAAGVAGSLVGAGTSIMNTGVYVWLMAILFAVLFVASVLVFVGRSVSNANSYE